MASNNTMEAPKDEDLFADFKPKKTTNDKATSSARVNSVDLLDSENPFIKTESPSKTEHSSNTRRLYDSLDGNFPTLNPEISRTVDQRQTVEGADFGASETNGIAKHDALGGLRTAVAGRGGISGANKSGDSTPQSPAILKPSRQSQMQNATEKRTVGDVRLSPRSGAPQGALSQDQTRIDRHTAEKTRLHSATLMRTDRIDKDTAGESGLPYSVLASSSNQGRHVSNGEKRMMGKLEPTTASQIGSRGQVEARRAMHELIAECSRPSTSTASFGSSQAPARLEANRLITNRLQSSMQPSAKLSRHAKEVHAASERATVQRITDAMSENLALGPKDKGDRVGLKDFRRTRDAGQDVTGIDQPLPKKSGAGESAVLASLASPGSNTLTANLTRTTGTSTDPSLKFLAETSSSSDSGRVDESLGSLSEISNANPTTRAQEKRNATPGSNISSAGANLQTQIQASTKNKDLTSAQDEPKNSQSNNFLANSPINELRKMVNQNNELLKSLHSKMGHLKADFTTQLTDIKYRLTSDINNLKLEISGLKDESNPTIGMDQKHHDNLSSKLVKLEKNMHAISTGLEKLDNRQAVADAYILEQARRFDQLARRSTATIEGYDGMIFANDAVNVKIRQMLADQEKMIAGINAMTEFVRQYDGGDLQDLRATQADIMRRIAILERNPAGGRPGSTFHTGGGQRRR